MKGLPETVLKAAHLAATFPMSLYRGLGERRLYEGIETCCLFVGYPRSGHSLVGSLVDAHPEAILAHELDLLQYVYARFGRTQICHLALANSRAFTESGRAWSGYSYAVPGQWQGRFERLRVIGDKHGESTAIRLKLTPHVLTRLEKTLRARVKLVHVIRNPYDNIATIEKNVATITRKLIPHFDSDLDSSIAYYFALCDAVVFAKESLGADILDVRQEALIERPEAELARICRFLGLEPSDEYLRACAGIVFASPRKTRHDTLWDSKALDAVARAAEKYPFLEGYTFESTGHGRGARDR
jgi:hypothetical protein